MKPLVIVSLVAAAALAACGDTATLSVSAGMGSAPQLPPPHQTLLPTVHIAPARGWSEGAKPLAAPGTSVSAYAKCKDSSGKAIPGVSVTFSWHYKTTTPSETLTTGSSGVATCTRSIGRATSGYLVSITISASYKGVTRTTSTGFTPR